MIKKILNILIIICFSIFLYSCQATQEVLSGKKRSEQSDEFLVEKKNPLSIPPDFEKLPKPGNQEPSNKIIEDETIKEILSINNDQSKEESASNSNTDIESSLIKKID